MKSDSYLRAALAPTSPGLTSDDRYRISGTSQSDDAEGARSRYLTGDDRAASRASGGVPVSTSSQGSARLSGPGVSGAPEDRVRARLLLASSRGMQTNDEPWHKGRILAGEVPRESRAGCSCHGRSRRDGMVDPRRLGVRDERPGRVGYRPASLPWTAASRLAGGSPALRVGSPGGTR